MLSYDLLENNNMADLRIEFLLISAVLFFKIISFSKIKT